MCLLARLPSVELGCGLGVTLLLMLLLFVVYHVFWLELLLLYRSWFCSDERLSGKLRHLVMSCGKAVHQQRCPAQLACGSALKVAVRVCVFVYVCVCR